MDVDGSGFLPVAWYAAGPEGGNAPSGPAAYYFVKAEGTGGAVA